VINETEDDEVLVVPCDQVLILLGVPAWIFAAEVDLSVVQLTCIDKPDV